MTGAAGAFGLELGIFVYEDRVVCGGLLGPADLRVGGAQAVAEVVGELVAEGVEVDGHLVEVAVVEVAVM